MAPPRGRGRPRKGQTRFDAAFDAMKDYGFADKLIKSTIKELLEVYMDEWKFIEEGSYEVLRENLLEKAKESEKDDSLRRDIEGVSPAGSSIKAPGPTHSNREIVPIEVPLQTVSEAIAAIENPKRTEKYVCNAYAEGERSSGKDKNAELDCIKINQTNNVQGTGDGSSSAAGKVERSKSASHCPSEFGIGSEKQEAPKAFTTRTRRPCYGWISDSDEPLERMMDLIPARATLDELLSGKRVPTYRKRRWDCKD